MPLNYYQCTISLNRHIWRENEMENVHWKNTKTVMGNEVATHRLVKSDPFHSLIADTKTYMRTLTTTEWFHGAWLFERLVNKASRTNVNVLLGIIRHGCWRYSFSIIMEVSLFKSVVLILELSHPLRRVFYVQHNASYEFIVIITLIWRRTSFMQQWGSLFSMQWNVKLT